MSRSILATQVLSISTALISSGGIFALTLFNVPLLQAQPASRSLPSIRWLFSRGSHIFPTAAFLSAAGFSYLAFAALPLRQKAILQLLKFASNSAKVNTYLAAAALSMSIGPVTSIMIPTNFTLIKLNEEKGGARSERLAREGHAEPSGRSAEESVNDKAGGLEWTDLSGPQGKTTRDSTGKEDERVRELLGVFGRWNAVRGGLLAAGGVVGLVAALM